MEPEVNLDVVNKSSNEVPVIQVKTLLGAGYSARLDVRAVNPAAEANVGLWHDTTGVRSHGFYWNLEPNSSDLTLRRRDGVPTPDKEVLRVLNSNGNVGIGTTTIDYKLEVNGTAGKSGGGSWSDSSDIRLKKNVKTIGDALEKMLRLRGVTYQWKEPEKHGDMKGTYMTMIAQEVEKVFPEWIGTDNEGYKTLGFIGFEALTAEAIKELKAENDVLKEKIRTLEARLTKLEK